jgi:hypothetical protein
VQSRVMRMLGGLMKTWRDVDFVDGQMVPVTTLIERWDDLEGRGVSSRARATLKARGEYDPAVHGPEDADWARPLTAEEHVELLALSEAIIRHIQVVGARLDLALQAGVTWADAAAAVDQDESVMRTLYRDWAARQRELNERHEGTGIGLTAEQYAAAIKRAES